MLSRILFAPGFILGLLILISVANGIVTSTGFYYHAVGTVDRFHIDSILHFLAGAWLAAVFFYLAARSKNIFDARAHIFVAFIGALAFTALIGVLWEFFEFGLDVVFKLSQQARFLDTIEDLAADCLGAFFMNLIYIRALRSS